jgi:glutamate-ammonia-ligase adenylyltransferase
MADLADRIRSNARGLSPDVVRAFLERTDREYLEEFPPPVIARHLVALTKLSANQPAAVLLEKRRDGAVECAVIAFDHRFEFSCITGIMAGTGFSIDRSDAFTLPKVKSLSRSASGDRDDPMREPVIIDYFQGRLLGPVTDFAAWKKNFVPATLEVIQLLDRNNEELTDRAKRLVNERVTQWLKNRRGALPPAVSPGSLEMAVQPLPGATRLRFHSVNAPAFLYALSTALSLHGLQIEKTRARTVEGRTIDEIDVTDRLGRPVEDPDSLHQLQRSVLLTLQFAYFLDRSPDPFTALQRFGELAEQIVKIPQARQWLELLANPLCMADLAKILGASNYLWEDFIRWNADALLPVFHRRVGGRELCLPAASLPRRLAESLAGARGFETQRTLLNEFKDRELFLIDLDHILAEENPDATFQILSERLVFLAENLVSAACELVWSELVRLYGRPVDPQRRQVGVAIFGLGKLGGVALGYASDIELLFLYREDGKTSGGTRGSLGNDEFFAILAREICATIQSRREGIFQIDLRLRPFGSNGPLANSKTDFYQYYRPGGPAHAFERLALVRLRWIAGDAKLGFEIERMRDELLYEGKPFDSRQVWEISAKMRVQKMSGGGKFNSKYSEGALADLEQTVQMLQIDHAAQAPQLRTVRLHEAMRGLHRAGIISATEFEQLISAYQFMRRLINAQRMLRGSARDLFLPPAGDELVYLARRMRYSSDDEEEIGAAMLRDFQRHTRHVTRFMRKQFRP